MIPWFIKFEMKKPKIFLAKTWRMILTRAFEKLGRWIFRHMVPTRFTTRGARELGFKERDPRYTIRKAIKKGHRNPWEWSGKMKSEALSIRDIRPKSKHVAVVLHIRQPPTRKGDAPLIGEMKKISRREQKELEAVLKKEIEREANKEERADNALSIRG